MNWERFALLFIFSPPAVACVFVNSFPDVGVDLGCVVRFHARTFAWVA